MGRREYGTGSIYQRVSDGRWVGTMEAGWTERGTRRRITVTGKTATEVRAKLKKKAIALATGTSASSPRTTVKSWSETWLTLVQRKAAPKYYATTRALVRQWIVPTVGHVRLATLTPAHVRAVSEAARKAGRSPATAKAAHDALLRMLRAAKREGHIIPDAALITESPAKGPSNRLPPSSEATVALLTVLQTHPHRARWLLAMLTGIRQGEALGLTWDRVNLDEGWIDISAQLQELPYADRSAGTFRVPDQFLAVRLWGAFHLVRPKTETSRRIIALTDYTAAMLREWHERAPENPWGIVFPEVRRTAYRSDPTRPLPARASNDRAEWRAIQTLAGVAHPSGRPYLVHEARNLAATGLNDASDAATIAILGHTDKRTSLIYQHADLAALRAALEASQRTLGVTAE